MANTYTVSAKREGSLATVFHQVTGDLVDIGCHEHDRGFLYIHRDGQIAAMFQRWDWVVAQPAVPWAANYSWKQHTGTVDENGPASDD